MRACTSELRIAHLFFFGQQRPRALLSSELPSVCFFTKDSAHFRVRNCPFPSSVFFSVTTESAHFWAQNRPLFFLGHQKQRALLSPELPFFFSWSPMRARTSELRITLFFRSAKTTCNSELGIALFFSWSPVRGCTSEFRIAHFPCPFFGGGFWKFGWPKTSHTSECRTASSLEFWVMSAMWREQTFDEGSELFDHRHTHPWSMSWWFLYIKNSGKPDPAKQGQLAVVPIGSAISRASACSIWYLWIIQGVCVSAISMHGKLSTQTTTRAWPPASNADVAESRRQLLPLCRMMMPLHCHEPAPSQPPCSLVANFWWFETTLFCIWGLQDTKMQVRSQSHSFFWPRGSTGVQRYGCIPRSAANNLGEFPQKLGAPKLLFWRVFLVERTSWDSSLLVSLTLWDTRALFTPPLPLPQFFVS